MTQPEDQRTTHFGLFSRMAERSNADLPALMRDKVLSPVELEALVDCCTQCRDVAGCRKLLNSDGTEPPDWCLNRRALAELAQTR